METIESRKPHTRTRTTETKKTTPDERISSLVSIVNNIKTVAHIGTLHEKNSVSPQESDTSSGTRTAATTMNRWDQIFVWTLLLVVVPMDGIAAFVLDVVVRPSPRSTDVRSAATSTTRIGTAVRSMPDDTDIDKNNKPPLLPVQVVDQMPEPLPANLAHEYYLLRHGQSTANVASIISSDRGLAYTEKHGLTSTGQEQGRQSAGNLLDLLRETAHPGDRVVFCSSPFARARQTAQACLEELQSLQQEGTLELDLDIATQLVYKDGLVERYFGRLDGEAIYTYAYVWPLDKMNVTHTTFDVESVAAVCSRIRDTVLALEDEIPSSLNKDDDTTTKTHVVLVSHADTLQIAKLYAAQAANVGEFSSYRFQNGEVRRMIVGSTHHFPDAVPLQGPKRCTKEKLKELDQSPVSFGQQQQQQQQQQQA